MKVAAGAAVGALLGLAAYGVKKVYDEYEEQKQRQCQREGAYGGKPANICEVDDDEDDEDYPSRNKASTSSSPSRTSRSQLEVRDEPLQIQLDHYHKTYCMIASWEMDRAKEVVEDVKKMILNFTRQNLRAFRVIALRDTGSTEEGLKVIKADEFDVLMHLELDPETWILKESEAAAGYWAVTKRDPVSSDSLDEFCNGQHLLPGSVVKHVQAMLERMVNFTSGKYEVSNAGPAMTLSVMYNIHGRTKRLEVNLIPVLNQNSVWVEAKPHPRSSVIPGYENFWRQSFAMEENQHLKNNPNLLPGSCHLKCLRIMKAVRLNHFTQLGALSSYALKTVLMHMLDQEDDWTDQVLSERIFDFLLALKQYLTAKELPNYFCPEMNLLEGIRPETCDAIRSFIIKKLDQGIADMLKTDY